MSWWPGGLIPILIYGTYSAAVEENDDLLTENDFEILTEGAEPILVE